MKKIVLAGLFNLATIVAFAQGGAVTSAISYQQQGTLDKAKEQIDKASTHEKTSKKAKTWFYRGEIYRSIAADQTGLYSKLDTNATLVAFDSYKKAMEVESDNSFAKQADEALKTMYLPAGGTKFQQKDYAGALELFKQAIEANPKDTTAYLYAGIAAQNQKDLPQAAQYFEKMIELGTTSPDVYATAASIYRSQNQNDKALEIVKKGVAKFPNDKTMKSEEFNLYVATGKTDEAKQNLEAAVQKEPNNATYLVNLGILYEQTDEPEKAVETYKKALQVEPENKDANLSLGVFHYNKGADISKQINNMELKQYQKEGKTMEAKLKEYFKEALPYFEKYYQQDATNMNVLQPLASIYKILEMKDKEQKVVQEIEAMN